MKKRTDKIYCDIARNNDDVLKSLNSSFTIFSKLN